MAREPYRSRMLAALTSGSIDEQIAKLREFVVEEAGSSHSDVVASITAQRINEEYAPWRTGVPNQIQREETTDEVEALARCMWKWRGISYVTFDDAQENDRLVMLAMARAALRFVKESEEICPEKICPDCGFAVVGGLCCQKGRERRGRAA